MPAVDHERTIRDYFDACTAGDAQAIASFFAPDAVHYFPDGDSYPDGSPQRALLDVNEVVGEMLVLLHREAERHSVTMRTELAQGLHAVRADRVQLQQVLMNLMVNGIEAMGEAGGELTIRTKAAESGLVVSVSDTGTGIPADKLEQIFSAFVTTKAAGTGMGLAISRTIVESHGGKLWAVANDGPGATFHFTLPAASAAAAARAASQ